jgi:hypothetical protein
VNSRFEKRHAEDIAESVSGVAHVQNNLRVQMAQGGGMGSGTGSGPGGDAQAGTVHHRMGSTGSQANLVGGATGTGGGETSTSDPGAGDATRDRRRSSNPSGT